VVYVIEVNCLRNKIWVHPEAPGMSRGAESTVFLPSSIFRGRLLLIILGPEQPSTFQDDEQILHKDIARQVLYSSEERFRSLPGTNDNPQQTNDPIPLRFFFFLLSGLVCNSNIPKKAYQNRLAIILAMNKGTLIAK